MKAFEKLYLTAFTDKNGRLMSEYQITGTPYILLAILFDLANRNVIEIVPNTTLLKMSVRILENSGSVSKIEQDVIDFVKINPNFDKADKNAEFMMNKKIFETIATDFYEQNLIVDSYRKFLFFKTKRQILTPKGQEIKENIVESIRANILEEGEIDPDVVILLLILDKLNLWSQYFSEFEKKDFKTRLQKLKNRNTQTSSQIDNLIHFVSSFDDTIILILGAVS